MIGGVGAGCGGVVDEGAVALGGAITLLPDVIPPFPMMASSPPNIVCLGFGAPFSGDEVVPALELELDTLALLDLFVLGVPVYLLPSHVRLLFRGLS